MPPSKVPLGASVKFLAPILSLGLLTACDLDGLPKNTTNGDRIVECEGVRGRVENVLGGNLINPRTLESFEGGIVVDGRKFYMSGVFRVGDEVSIPAPKECYAEDWLTKKPDGVNNIVD